MRLSVEQLERLSERVFQVLKASGHVGFDYHADEKVEERVLETIITALEEDAKTEDRLSREAERLVSQQQQIARASGKPMEQLVEEVKTRLAKSKKIVLGDGPERADSLAEKVFKAIWKVEGIDFFSEDTKVQNCVARSIYRFRREDDKLLDAVENLVNRKFPENPFSSQWCIHFDRLMTELKHKIESSKSVKPVALDGTEAGV